MQRLRRLHQGMPGGSQGPVQPRSRETEGRAEIFRAGDTQQAGILKLGHAPCKVTCPANINVQGYIQLIKKKEYVKAVRLIRERNPLSAICGRVCPGSLRRRLHPGRGGRAPGDQAAQALRLRPGDDAGPLRRACPPGGKRAAGECKKSRDHRRRARRALPRAGTWQTGVSRSPSLKRRSAAGGMLRWGIPAVPSARETYLIMK